MIRVKVRVSVRLRLGFGPLIHVCTLSVKVRIDAYSLQTVK